MIRFLFLSILSLLLTAPTAAQDSTQAADRSTDETVALYTMTGIIVPLAIAGTVISAVPPSISIISRDGVHYGAFTVQTGLGTGSRRETGIFSDWRLALSYTFVVNSSIRNPLRLEATRDFHLDFLERRKIVLAGGHVSAGVLTDFPEEGYSVGGGVWVKTPWIGYFGFFPEHTYGLTYRFNKFFGGTSFHELSVGMTSAFTF